MLTNNRIVDGDCAQPSERITDGNCAQKPGFQRINAGDCGSGDGGFSQVQANGLLFSKDDAASHFYGSIEVCRLATGKLLARNRLALKVQAIPFIGKRASTYFEITPLCQSDVIQVLEWLQKASFSLNSYCYSASEPDVEVPYRHALPDGFHQYIEDQSRAWKKYAPSREFQYFEHPNLLALDEIRIAFREAERWYCKWKRSQKIMEAMSQKPALAASIRLQGATLNRLSYYFWCVIGREYSLCGESKHYWDGYMPAFSQDVLAA